VNHSLEASLVLTCTEAFLLQSRDYLLNEGLVLGRRADSPEARAKLTERVQEVLRRALKTLVGVACDKGIE
jgi:hypothetical protein